MKKHLAATALICLLPSAFAQTLYKCGNSYHQTPCDASGKGAIVVTPASGKAAVAKPAASGAAEKAPVQNSPIANKKPAPQAASKKLADNKNAPSVDGLICNNGICEPEFPPAPYPQKMK